MSRTFWTGAALAVLSACSSGGGDASGVLGASGSSSNGIAAPTVTRASGPDATRTGTLRIADGGGASYSISIDPAAGPTVSAELLSGTGDLTPPTTGRATMRGKYGLLKIEDAQQVDGVWTGTTSAADGDITLTARFGSGRLTGGGDGLTVDGRITPDGLDGLVSYHGIQATLDGTIGPDGTVGVFYGGGAGRGLAGGFAASAK